MFAKLKTNSTLGAGPHTSFGESGVLTAKTTTSQRDLRPVVQFSVDGSVASESVTADATGFVSHQRASPTDEVESADGKPLLVEGFGRRHLPVHQEDGPFQGETQHLMLERVDHVLGQGHRYLISAKALTKAMGAPLSIYPEVTAIQHEHGDESLIFTTLRRGNGLFEVKARRDVPTSREPERPCPSKALVAARRYARDIMDFYNLLGNPSEDLTLRSMRFHSSGYWSAQGQHYGKEKLKRKNNLCLPLRVIWLYGSRLEEALDVSFASLKSGHDLSKHVGEFYIEPNKARSRHYASSSLGLHSCAR